MSDTRRRATRGDVAFALIAGPGIGLIGVLVAGVAFAGVPLGYLIGLPVAPAVTALYVRRRGRSVATILALAAVSLGVTMAVVGLLILLLVLALSETLSDFD